MTKVLLYLCILLFLFNSTPKSQAPPSVSIVMARHDYVETMEFRNEPTPTPTITPTSTPEPTPRTDFIPTPKYDYGCKPKEGVVCVNPSMSFDEQVTHVLFMEGAMDGLQLTVDMLQVMHNRAVNAWECSINDCGVEELEALNPNKIPWTDITDEQAERLVLYLLSIPYTSRGETHPAWNGWSQPMQFQKITDIYPRKYNYYLYTYQAVGLWRENCIGYDHEDGNDTCVFLYMANGKTLRPQHPICAENVLYVYFTRDKMLPDEAPVVAYDKMDYGDYVVYVQFLTFPGHGFDPDR